MDNKDWATPTLKESPFWRDGMTPEEFEEERNYFLMHIQEWQMGTYKPLWQQNNEDYQKYEAEFEILQQKMNEELSHIKTQDVKVLDREMTRINKKYSEKIKELQKKYSYLFV